MGGDLRQTKGARRAGAIRGTIPPLGALLLSLLFTAPAFAFFGNPCLISPYNYIKCYGENPGSVRTDIGNEIMSIAREVWNVQSMLTSLKAPDFMDSLSPDMFMNRETKQAGESTYEQVRLGMEDREKLLSPAGNIDTIAFEDAGKREFLPVATSGIIRDRELGADFAAKLGNDIAGTEGLRSLTAGMYDREIKEKNVLTEGMENDGDLENSLMKILEGLGLGADGLAVVRNIAQNLGRYNTELGRQSLLMKELSDIRAENAIQWGRISQMSDGLYSCSVGESVRRGLDK